MVALLIKSRSGPSQPDLGGGRREEKEEKEGKTGKKQEKGEISVTTLKNVSWVGVLSDAV